MELGECSCSQQIAGRRKMTFADQEVSHTISDVKKKEFVRSSFRMPFSAKTRKETLAESAQNPNLKMMPVLITVTTNGGEWRSVDAGAGEWQSLRDLRYSVRATVPFHLLEAIERMRGSVFATPVGSVFYSLVGKYVVYQTADDAKLELEELRSPPDCDFDNSFGYPCSEVQKKRVKAAADSGETLTRY